MELNNFSEELTKNLIQYWKNLIDSEELANERLKNSPLDKELKNAADNECASNSD